jgi:serine/threonine protein kinase
MTPDIWRQVERLYHLALAQPAEGRAAFLTQACGGDEALRREVESLLAASEGDDEYLETPALTLAAEALETDPGAKPAPPPSLGRYRITGELGSGGMGIVYRGIDPVIGRTVAIKTILQTSLGTPAEAAQLTERLKREARAAGSLTHPNIVTVFDAGEEQGFTYIVMEFIPGSTLDAVLESAAARLPHERALDILAQAAAALDFAHSLGVVHRDVKPSNIMVQQDGRVKLTDFGIARRMTSASFTRTGAAVGSPYYMAPEQLRGQEAVPRSDQYSLAVVAWILLTGSKPFDGESMISLIEKIRAEDPARSNHLSPEADAVLRRALCKDPSGRFESCDSFVTALRDACQISQKPAAKHGRMAVAGILAACVLTGAAIAWKFRTAPPAAVAEAPKPASNAPLPVASPAPSSGNPAEKGPAPADKLDKHLHAAAAPLVLARKPGETKTNSRDGLTYVWVPPGSFSMGCSPHDAECAEDERPEHAVTISKGFWMGQTEVTEEAYRKVTGKEEGLVRRANRPAHSAAWEEAKAYCDAVVMRLPTEAEWEYAARAGSAASRYGELDLIAWYDGNSGQQTHDVAGKKPNAWGLYDMLGNVWEWTADWYGRYAPEPAADPQGPASGPFRVRRGGGSRVGAKMARASYRVKFAERSNYSAGFRCAGN